MFKAFQCDFTSTKSTDLSHTSICINIEQKSSFGEDWVTHCSMFFLLSFTPPLFCVIFFLSNLIHISWCLMLFPMSSLCRSKDFCSETCFHLMTVSHPSCCRTTGWLQAKPFCVPSHHKQQIKIHLLELYPSWWDHRVMWRRGWHPETTAPLTSYTTPLEDNFQLQKIHIWNRPGWPPGLWQDGGW